MQSVVIVGDVVMGLEFIGPFPNAQVAVEWCEVHFDRDAQWNVAALGEPDLG